MSENDSDSEEEDLTVLGGEGFTAEELAHAEQQFSARLVSDITTISYYYFSWHFRLLFQLLAQMLFQLLLQLQLQLLHHVLLQLPLHLLAEYLLQTPLELLFQGAALVAICFVLLCCPFSVCCIKKGQLQLHCEISMQAVYECVFLVQSSQIQV